MEMCTYTCATAPRALFYVACFMPVALVASVCNQLSFKFLNSVSTKVHENSLQQTRTYLHDTSFHALTSDLKILLQKSTSLNPWKA